MVIMPVLEALPVLPAAEYCTFPLPVPLLPEVIVIQPALLTAVQGQTVAAVTLTLPVTPVALAAALKDILDEVME
jgi:hypothetical protein